MLNITRYDGRLICRNEYDIMPRGQGAARNPNRRPVERRKLDGTSLLREWYRSETKTPPTRYGQRCLRTCACTWDWFFRHRYRRVAVENSSTSLKRHGRDSRRRANARAPGRSFVRSAVVLNFVRGPRERRRSATRSTVTANLPVLAEPAEHGTDETRFFYHPDKPRDFSPTRRRLRDPLSIPLRLFNTRESTLVPLV